RIGCPQRDHCASLCAKAHDVEVIYLGTIGTRPYDIDQLVRKRLAKAQHLAFVDEAGLCGNWLYRYLTQTGDGCWVVAPSLLPTKAGDRVKPDRRDAVPWARPLSGGSWRSSALPLRSQSSCKKMSVRFTSRPHASSVSNTNGKSTCKPGVCTRW